MSIRLRQGDRNQCRAVSGFTLIELMVTIAVLAIGAAIAYPSFTGVIQSNRVATSANELMASIALARSEAIRNNRGAAICASSEGIACDGSWGDEGGWLVWGDNGAGANAANGTLDADETVLRFGRLSDAMDIAGPAANLRFDNRGRIHSSTVTAQQFTLQPMSCPAGKNLVRRLRVNVSGQVTMERSDCA